LTSATATDQTHLELNFDEEVTPIDSLWVQHLRIFSAAAESLRILAAMSHPLNQRQLHLLTGEQRAVTYKIFAEQIVDAAGNPLDSLSQQTEFTGSAKPDSTRPRIVKATPADSSRSVSVATSIEMIFSELMANAPALANVSPKPIAGNVWPLAVQDSAGQAVKGKGLWLNPLQFRFQPDSLLKSRARYVVKILSDSSFDASGNALFDTLEQITFWTMNADTLTAISGTISDAQAEATGSVHLVLKQVAAFSGSSLGTRPAPTSTDLEYSTILTGPGPYLFDHILPGLYQLSGFRDANRNSRFDYGAPFPFAPAERFAVWPDTMKVRSRWPNEGNDFVIP
jgi:hypothetical protein